MASPCFAILTQPFRSFHKKEKKKKSKSNRGRRAPLLSPDRMNHSVIFFRFTLISLREGCRFSNTWQQVSLDSSRSVLRFRRTRRKSARLSTVFGFRERIVANRSFGSSRPESFYSRSEGWSVARSSSASPRILGRRN